MNNKYQQNILLFIIAEWIRMGQMKTNKQINKSCNN